MKTRIQNSGQALVALLVFMIIAIIMTTMAIALTVISATSASKIEQGDMALRIAESGAENALLRLVRNPFYAGEETFTINEGTVIATVSGTSPIIIVSTGTVGLFQRSSSVSASFVNSVLTVHSWSEGN